MSNSRRSPIAKELILGSKVSHSDLARSICKVTSFIACGKLSDAKTWADVLREQLNRLGL